MFSVCLLFLCVWFSTPGFSGTITLAVAANFYDTARQLAVGFEKSSSHKLRLVKGSTGALHHQITQGAPYDVFLAADRRHIKSLGDMGFLDDTARFVYAEGQLVLACKRGVMSDLGVFKLHQNERLAMAKPEQAPYGLAAQQTLVSLGLWPVAKSQLLLAQNVGQALQFFRGLSQGCGFIAFSQLKQWRRTVGTTPNYVVIPEEYYGGLPHEAAVTRYGSKWKGPYEFMSYLKSSGAQAVVESFGYRRGCCD